METKERDLEACVTQEPAVRSSEHFGGRVGVEEPLDGDADGIERDIVRVGLAGMIDTSRKEAKLAVVTLPPTQPVFEVAAHPGGDWPLVLGLEVIPLVVIEAAKLAASARPRSAPHGRVPRVADAGRRELSRDAARRVSPLFPFRPSGPYTSPGQAWQGRRRILRPRGEVSP